MISTNSCVMCDYNITDPVCRDCYIKQTMMLLSDLKINSFANEIISNKIKKNFPIETVNETTCILCQKENVTLCRYCFSVLLIRILRELNFTENLVENFEYNPLYGEFTLEDELFDNKNCLEIIK